MATTNYNGYFFSRGNYFNYFFNLFVYQVYRMTVSIEHQFPSCEGADQHQQAGLGQVEVREHNVRRQEFEARIDEEVRLTGPGGDSTIMRGRLDGADARRTDSDPSLRSLNCRGGRLWNRPRFRVELILFNRIVR